MKVFLPCVHPYSLKDGLILVSDSHITANVIMITGLQVDVFICKKVFSKVTIILPTAINVIVI